MRVSVVIPCLNEARTIARVIEAAHEGLRLSGLDSKTGEVVVADNGSTDGSQAISEAAGARVVNVPIRGYGAALHYGILGARGEYVIFGDADLSYDFKLLPRFTAKLADAERSGGTYDMILGSRLRGQIMKGAMPFLNHYVGTPVLNLVILLFFGLKTTDCNSGMRFLRRDFYLGLPMRAPGMEWASELLIKAKIFNARYAEVPITLHPDQRGRPPHLRRWRDGWRHLKTITLLSPNRLIALPSVILGILSVVMLAAGETRWFPALSNIALSGLFLWLLVKLILHADGVRGSRLIRFLLASAAAEWLLCSSVVLTTLGLLGASFSENFSKSWLLSSTLVSAGVITMLCSFAWGSLITHFVRTLEQKQSAGLAGKKPFN